MPIFTEYEISARQLRVLYMCDECGMEEVRAIPKQKILVRSWRKQADALFQEMAPQGWSITFLEDLLAVGQEHYEAVCKDCEEKKWGPP